MLGLLHVIFMFERLHSNKDVRLEDKRFLVESETSGTLDSFSDSYIRP